MKEHREEHSTATLTLDAFADLVGGRVSGDGSRTIDGICPVDDGRRGHIAFLASSRYVRFLSDCPADAFLVDEKLLSSLPAGAAAVVVSDSRAALRLGLLHFHPASPSVPAIHPTAVVGDDVVLGAGVDVAPYVVIGAGARLGDGVTVGAHCVIGAGSQVGERSRLHPHVVLYDNTVLGRDVVVHSGARLGSDGFGFVVVDGEHRRIPHAGRLVVEDGVEVGANSTIDRGSLGDTVIGAGVKIDNLVHVAHNVRIGARTMLAALVGIAGSTRIGRGTWFGGQSGVCNQAEVGDGVRVAVQTGITRDVPDGQAVSGFPGRPHREVLRRDALAAKLPDFVERLVRLEEAQGSG